MLWNYPEDGRPLHATLVAGTSLIGHLDWATADARPWPGAAEARTAVQPGLLALPRLTAASFGTLMSLEPAIPALIGFTILSRAPPESGP